MTKTIRIQTTINSYARNFDMLDSLAVTCKHNGGKIVIVTVDADDIDAARAVLEDSYKVAAFEVVS